jgi:hypothetical protein
MDIVTDPTFWGDVGLTAAARLAVLAAMLWIARLAVRYAPPRPAHRAEPSTLASEDRREPAPLTRYIDLRQTPQRRSLETKPLRQEPSRSSPLRNRLREYLEQETTERSRS